MATMVQGGGESVPMPLDAVDSEKNDTKKRRFLWGLRRMFRRRGTRSEQESREPSSTPGPPTLRGRSSDHLLTDDDSPKKKRQQSGLSVSHDSVFTAEASGADSDEERTRSRLRPSAAVSAELAAAVRRRARGDTSEEDEDLGLPRSPSPHKRGTGRSRIGQSAIDQSSCSEGSLLSAGSSDPDDECHSSKGDLTSTPITPLTSISSFLDSADHNAEEPPIGLAPLSHSAARHKMAIKPRRTHGPPRRARPIQLSPSTVLPSTPEVNEDNIRSITPEEISLHKTETTTSTHHFSTSTSIRFEKTHVSHLVENILLPDEANKDQVPMEIRLKSSSLPSGLALSQLIGQNASPIKLSLSTNDDLTSGVKIGRSKSNAQKKDNLDVDADSMINDYQFSTSEKNISHQQSINKESIKIIDAKYSNTNSESQRKFNSISVSEEFIKTETSELPKSEHKFKKYNEKNSAKDYVYGHSSASKNYYKGKIIKETEEHSEKQVAKKEESFFGRLLLRKSGKKNKKELNSINDDLSDIKKQSHKDQQNFKNSSDFHDYQKSACMNRGIIRQQKMVCSEQNTHKSIGQKIFLNQNHKRIDIKGGYVNDKIADDSPINYSKNSMSEYGSNDAKYFEEYDKLAPETFYPHINSDSKRLSSENIHKGSAQPKLRQRMEPLDIPASPEARKKPVTPKTPENKSFFPTINQGKIYPTNEGINGSRFIKNTKTTGIYKDEFHSASPKGKTNSDVFTFGSQVFNQSPILETKPISYSVSPPRSVWPTKVDSTSYMKSSSQGSLDHQSCMNLKPSHNPRKCDFHTSDLQIEHLKSKPKIAGLSSYQQKISQIGGQTESDIDKSCVDSSLISRNPVIKSHSFRINSDTSAYTSSQDMPSLPPLFGASESSMDSWESYKKSPRDSSDQPISLELGSDSLMNYSYKPNVCSLEKNYSDTAHVPTLNESGKTTMSKVHESINSYKVNTCENRSEMSSVFSKSIPLHSSKLQGTDMSQIEANIDSIIGSPKPLNCVILKSNSLDSVKSFTEKSPEQGRKAISNESILQSKIYLNQPEATNVAGSVNFNKSIMNETTKEIKVPEATCQLPANHTLENNVTVTVLNQPNYNVTKTFDSASTKQTESNMKTSEKQITRSQNIQKETKSSDKILTSSTNSAIPEFMKIQLNKVDQKLNSNVVLSTSMIDNKLTKTVNKIEKSENIHESVAKHMDRSVSHEPNESEKATYYEVKKSDSLNRILDNKDFKPQRKFSSEDVEILEKSDINNQNSVMSRKSLLTSKSIDVPNYENVVPNMHKSNDGKMSASISTSYKKVGTPICSLPPVSPVVLKGYNRKKSECETDSLKRQYTPPILDQKSNNVPDQSINRLSSSEQTTEYLLRNDRSSSSSDDTNLESTVILRKKSLSILKNNSKTDDEPELMKVFARRSLKLKDSESEALAQDILNASNNENKEDENEEAKRKLKYNSLTRSRDSDKENEVDSPKDERKKSISNTDTSNDNNNKVMNKNSIEYQRNNENTELVQNQRISKKIYDSPLLSTNTGSNIPKHNINTYQRSISANIPLSQPSLTKGENKNDMTSFKKEISDSTPEKRLRNRTFPDSNNENNKDETSKIMSNRTETSHYSVDTSSLPKRSWSYMKNETDGFQSKEIKIPFRKSSFASVTEVKTSNKPNPEKLVGDIKDNTEKTGNEAIKSSTENGTEGASDGSPQFKGILQMRAEWERRAQQAMTK